MIFRVEAQGDTIFVRADNENALPAAMKRNFGFIPGSAYTASPIEEDDVPKHEDIWE